MAIRRRAAAMLAAVAKGDLLAATAAGVWQRLAVGSDGQELVADSTQTAGVKWTGRTRVVAEQHTDTGPSNTTNETNLISFPIPTSVAAGDKLRLTMWGDLLNNTGGSVSFQHKVSIGATTAIAGAANNLSTAASRRDWRIEMDVVVVATNDQRLNALNIVSAADSAKLNSASTITGDVASGTAAEDLTAGKNLVWSMTLGSASALHDFICHGAVLEIVKKG